MKTHELADQLEALAKLLRGLPDIEIKNAPGAPADLVASNVREQILNAHSRVPPTLPDGIEARLSTMKPEEIELYLGSDQEAFTAASLMLLAERLGISTSKRQNRRALINLITRHFEAGQLDSMIRGVRKNET